ncbi:MAG: hypothetical protein ACLGH0_08030, partial [Thermoanaerobaculia bacterium]
MPSRPDLWSHVDDIARLAFAARPHDRPDPAARIHPSVFADWARDAAAAFGDADAAEAVHPILSALIEGIKILDDIQDEEEHCLAT